ncbi:hypothetical protein [Fulvivirga lutea]|uniref:Uncharacterized protein n=1 Tax=Fulvivirga lutea TaxID=2810512 RepID=A0A974WJK0_9BACT|nr:hypothetical protein [Fulvivirga lutea]QSE97340.1 hypothetical protein JR347_17420 [Fulvivirga lutea]
MEGLINYLPGRVNSLLSQFGLLFIILAVVCFVLMIVDSRMLMGVNIWLKPLKFAISISIFLITSAYIIELLPISISRKNLVVWLLIVTMLIEIICIIIQAARGQLSHFNITDPLGSILFPLMGIAITITYVVYAYLLIEFIKQPIAIPQALLWAIWLGLIIFLFVGISGFMMASNLKHSIGIADGGMGLPFTNWSTVGGDLRVSHFISLHAIQILPLLAILIARIDVTNGKSIVITTGFLYLIFAILTLIQALYGKPFIKLNN